MKLLIAVFLSAFLTAASLNVRRPSEGTPGTHYVPGSGTASLESGNSTWAKTQDPLFSNPLMSFDVASNTTCSGSECRFKSVHSSTAKLVWFLGCSLDSQAVVHTCWSGGAPASQSEDPLFKFCTFNGFTLVFTFHPGATPPPYYDYYKFETTTQHIVQTSLLQIQHMFGKLPDATVIDSSLWDVANWWKKNGAPTNWPVPTKEISQWSSYTVPTFLDFVQATIPSTHVAFRTAPPVFPSCQPGFEYMCRGPEIIEMMYGLMIKATNPTTHLLYNKYTLIDYHQVVLSQHKALGGDLRLLYNDNTPPGRDLSLAYIGAVLNWVQTW